MKDEKDSIPMKNATTLKDVLKETLTLDQIALPVLARLKKRYKEIQKLSQAKNQKIPLGLGGYSIFKTTPPKIFISGLDTRYDGKIGVIVYMTYATEKNAKTGELQKVLENIQTMTSLSGKEIQINGNYQLDKVFIETFEYGKAIDRKVILPKELGLGA